MATSKKKFQYILQICKLCGQFLLPFLLSFVSLNNLDEKRSICLIKNIFDIECWGCGITKAIIAAIQLDFIKALDYNPLVVIVMPLIIYYWGKEIVKTRKSLKTR